MTNTAENIANAARINAYQICQAYGIKTSGNSRLDMMNIPAFNAAYRKEYNRIMADYINSEKA